MDRFKGLKIGLQSFTLRKFDMAGVVERMNQLGLKYLELAKKHLTPEMGDEAMAQAKDLCAKAGITINCVGVGNLVNDIEKNRPLFEFAKKLGVGNVMANPMHDSLGVVGQLADEYQIKVGIHNHGPTSTWPDIETIEKHIAGTSPLVGLCVDTGHFTRVPVDPIEVFNHFKERVHSVHLKDIDQDQDGKHGQEHIIGDGCLNLTAVIQLLQKWNFQGPISIEYEINADDPMGDLAVALDHIEKALA